MASRHIVRLPESDWIYSLANIPKPVTPVLPEPDRAQVDHRGLEAPPTLTKDVGYIVIDIHSIQRRYEYKQPMQDLYLGLISGTSMDAVDAALVDLSEPASPSLVASSEQPYPPSVREDIVRILSDPDKIGLTTLGVIDGQIGTAFAEAANALIRRCGITSDQVRAIGSHGQNLYHAPNASPPFSLQLGDPNVIAERTGITTVADFRRRDMAAGGQGAPLAPALHQALFGAADETRCVVNLGGIANITLLPSAPGQPVSGFDTGPANALMDAWAQA